MLYIILGGPAVARPTETATTRCFEEVTTRTDGQYTGL